MTWHKPIHLAFARAYFRNPTPSSWDFHGAYNIMMLDLFQSNESLLVSPHFVSPNNSTFWFEVTPYSQCHGPIFFLEIGSPSDLESIEKREKADLRTRARMAKLVGAYH